MWYYILLILFLLAALIVAWIITHPKKAGRKLGLLKFMMVWGRL